MGPEVTLAEFSSFVFGMSDGASPAYLGEGRYTYGENVDNTGGHLRSRAGFSAPRLLFPAGVFQGCGVYRLSNRDRIVAAVGGRVYLGVIDGVATLKDHDPLHPTLPCHFCQIERYFVVQDSDTPTIWEQKAWPVMLDDDAVYDQSALRASSPHTCFPKGTSMAFGHGVAVVTSPWVWDRVSNAWTESLGETGWLAGDLQIPWRPETVLRFEATTYWNEGGRNAAPAEFGKIVGMGLQSSLPTATGHGPLIVGCERGFYTFAINALRAEWKSLDFGLTVFMGIGLGSPRGFAPLASDLYVRTTDGVRGIIATQQGQMQLGFGEAPISCDVQRLMDLDTAATRRLSSTCVVGNTLYTTVLPMPGTDGDFLGIAAFNTKPITATGKAGAPAWMGTFTGHRFLAVLAVEVDGKQTLGVITREANGFALRTLTGAVGYDGDAPVQSRVVLRPIATAPFDMKKLSYIEVHVSRVKGNVTLTGFYRPLGASVWKPLISRQIKVADQYEQWRRPIKLGPADPGDVSIGQLGALDQGTGFEVALQWTGSMRVDRCRARGNHEAESGELQNITDDVTLRGTFTELGYVGNGDESWNSLYLMTP